MSKLLKVIIQIPVPPAGLGKALVGNLDVDAVQNKRDDFDFNYIKWNEVDILPLLDNLTEAGDILQMVREACKAYVDNLEPFDRWQLETHGNILDKYQLVGETRYSAFMQTIRRGTEQQAELQPLNFGL